MKREIVLSVVLCGLLSSICGAEIISASSDGFVQHSGSNGRSAATDSTEISTRRSGGNNIRHGLFEFDLRELYFPAGASIQSAFLQFELTQLISNTQDEAEVAFYGYASDGVLDVSDFDTPSASDVNRVATEIFPARSLSPSVGTLLTVEFDHLASLTDALTQGERYFTVRSETVNFVTFEVGALENVTTVPPSLVITTRDLRGDFNRDGVVDIADIDVMQLGEPQFDLTEDGQANQVDLSLLVSTLIGTWFGDSNGDGQFESGDLVAVFARGKFETGHTALWPDGDWNQDGVFNTQDFVKAFSDGGFERGHRTVSSLAAPISASEQALAAVPEPNSLVSCFAASLVAAVLFHTQRQAGSAYMKVANKRLGQESESSPNASVR